MIARIRDVLFYVYARCGLAEGSASVYLRLLLLLFLALGLSPLNNGQPKPQSQNDWQLEVRRLVDVRDWVGALRLVDEQIARSPKDLDIKAWRARILTWADRLEEAERAYREIVNAEESAHYDPDHWSGLATVCWRLGQTQEALQAIKMAVEIDPKRADLHASYARILQSAGLGAQAEAEYKKASELDPGTFRSNQPIKAGRKYPSEVRIGSDTDLLNYAAANHGEWANFTSHWTPHVSTSVGFGLYQRSGIFAGKVVGSVTAQSGSFGAFTVGGAKAEDHGVIPRSEAFFDYDHGLKRSEGAIIRGFEFEYGQRWYWYSTVRVLTLNGAGTLYFPGDWSFTLGAAGARSAFSGLGAEWRPSGIARLALPIRSWGDARVTGNVFFGVGSENFGLLDQIGRFASQTYGGGLHWEWSVRQFIGYTFSYQRRTQARTDAYHGITYGFHF